MDVGIDVNADFTRGTALRVEGRHLLRGPVTSVAPLRVMGQEVLTSSSTVLGSGLAGDFAVPGGMPKWQAELAQQFKTGPVYLAVSGYLSGPGQVQATRLSLVPNPPVEWKLIGAVARSTQGRLTLGEQTVLVPAGAGDCGPTVEAGQVVDLRFEPDRAYLLSIGEDESDALGALTASTVKCISTALTIPEGVSNSWLAVGMEGFVSNDAGGDGYTFLVEGQPVLTTEATTYRFGNKDSIRVGARVQVDGLLDLTTGVLQASSVQFYGGEVRIEAPVSASTDELLTMIGVSVWRTPSTRGDLDLFGSRPTDGLVRVEGFQGLGSVVYAGNVQATRSRSFGRVSVQAPVEFVWHRRTSGFSMLGLSVDIGRSVLRGPDGSFLGPREFLQLLRPGIQVRVSDAHFFERQRKLYDAKEISIRSDDDDFSLWSN